MTGPERADARGKIPPSFQWNRRARAGTAGGEAPPVRRDQNAIEYCAPKIQTSVSYSPVTRPRPAALWSLSIFVSRT